MVQDDYGYLYISTYDGLIRYDGYDFTVYNSGNTEEMETNRISGLIKSRDNTIWLFNETGTITSKSGETFTKYSSAQLPGRANRIVESTDGRIWVIGSQGVAYFDTLRSSFQKIDSPILNSSSEALGVGINGEIFVVNEFGLISWHNYHTTLLLPESESPVSSKRIRGVLQFDEELIWLIGAADILKFNRTTKQVETMVIPDVTDASVWNIKPKSNGDYILTASSGFYILDTHSLSLRKLPIQISSPIARSNLVFTGYEFGEIYIGDDEVIIDGKEVLKVPSIKFGFLDKEGSLWIGSETDGLYQIRKSSFINLTSEYFDGLTNVYSVIQDHNNDIWTCSLNEGISRISASGNRNWTQTNSSLISNICRFVYSDDDGSIHAGFIDHGLWTYDTIRDNWVPYENVANLEIPEAMHRRGDQLLIGHKNTLIIHENDEFRIFKPDEPLYLSGIQVFNEDSRGLIYAGTSGNGLSRIDGAKVRNYSTTGGVLSSNIIRDIFVQSDDTLWIATENRGLNRLVLDFDGNVISSVSITSSNGLIHNSLHRIIEDPYRYLWISSNGGIMRIGKRALNDFADGVLASLPVLSFNERDGMLNREANGGVHSAGILSADNMLWFPNQRGITIINPSDFSVDQNLELPIPIFESIELDNERIYITGKDFITIPARKRDLRVNFTAPNFAYQDRVNFSYKLEGVNQTWQSADQSRQAVFTGVPPGEHTLTIRAAFIGGEPVETATIIEIPKFFYETGLFRALMFLLVMGFIAGVFKLRLRRLQDKERKLQLLVDEQTIELKKAAEQKSRFFTGITHELKTPLSLIIGPLDDMMEKNESGNDAGAENRLSMMHRNSYRLKHLVDQILDVSKLNADAIRFNLQPVDILELSRQIIGQFQSKLEQENLTLEISGDVPSDMIYVDREAWERIIINLLSNAIKFSPSGSAIHFSITNSKQEVALSFKDEGPGIRMDDQPRVFEYLYQVHGHRAAEGTGIGLFLVKGLVEHMGGKIDLISEEGKGAEFIVTLRKGFQHFDPEHTISHEVQEISPSRNHHSETTISESLENSGILNETHGETILIVEDNADFREYLKMSLSPRYAILEAGNGESALELLTKHHPNIIISDIMMPGMNGLEFVNTLRKQPKFEHIPVIFLSAKNEDIDVEMGLSTGADIYLTKPIRISMLLAQIEAILRRERILTNMHQPDAMSTEPEFLTKVREIVFRQLANPSLTVNQLADTLYLSRTKLYVEWRKVSDLTINDFIKQQRLNEAHILIKERGFNVQEAAHAVGFSDPNYFSTSFKKAFGMSPSEARQK